MHIYKVIKFFLGPQNRLNQSWIISVMVQTIFKDPWAEEKHTIYSLYM